MADLQACGAGSAAAERQPDRQEEDALKRLLAAARRGNAKAYHALGTAYSLGEGVDINLIEAHRWFNLAALSGIKGAQAERAEIASSMTAAEIAEAQRLAREWVVMLSN